MNVHRHDAVLDQPKDKVPVLMLPQTLVESRFLSDIFRQQQSGRLKGALMHQEILGNIFILIGRPAIVRPPYSIAVVYQYISAHEIASTLSRANGLNLFLEFI